MSNKCKLKNCLNNNDSGNCDIMMIPPCINGRSIDSIDCIFYSTSLSDELKWLKSKGGIHNIVTSNLNKLSHEELIKIKKSNKERRKAASKKQK